VKNKKNTSLKDRRAITIAVGSLLVGIMISLIFIPFLNDKSAFGQKVEKIGLEFNSSISNNINNTSSPNQLPVNEQAPLGFVAKGTINSVITVPVGKWLATGDWIMILNNGIVTLFDTNMTWYNSSGTTAHTHELINFKPVVGGQAVSLEQPTNNSIMIKGFTDIGTNNQISWSEVPTTIVINGRKIVSISLDDNATNRHFGGQPILGVVSSFVPCSDLPGANMEVLTPCTVPATVVEDTLSLPNDTISEDAPGVEEQSSSFPSEDAPGVEEQSSSFPSEDAPGVEEQSSFALQNNTECEDLDINNVTSSGFEAESSDYHPPSDAIDSKSSTWWSNQDENSWLQVDLGGLHIICGLSVEWNKGDTREYTFDIEVSDTGNNFEKVFEGSNKLGSSAPETYPIDKIQGQYIRLAITGTSSEAGWVSIKELKVTGHTLS
jgi:hypothetical protein